MKVKTKRELAFTVLMLLPSLVLYSRFYLWPSLQAFVVSTYRWNGLNPENIERIGLGNFRRLIRDQYFHTAITNNLIIEEEKYEY